VHAKKQKLAAPTSTRSIIAAEIAKRPGAPKKEILRHVEAECKKLGRKPVSKSTFYAHFNTLAAFGRSSPPEDIDAILQAIKRIVRQDGRDREKGLSALESVQRQLGALAEPLIQSRQGLSDVE
jgi:hypothetical protein